MKGKRQRPQGFGVDDRGLKECGLCGERVSGKLSKTHVPPQCAGNTGEAILRYRLEVVDGRMVPGRRDKGGIWFRGLCGTCNSAAGHFDDAYGAFVKLLPVPDEVHQDLWLPGNKVDVLNGPIRPGAIARSILFGAFALNPLLRTAIPAIASNLLNDKPIHLASHCQRLSIANAVGSACRVHGLVSYLDPYGQQVHGKAPSTISSAAVHLRPLAWMLDTDDSYGLPDTQGWINISSWLLADPDEVLPAPLAVPRLPPVDLEMADSWILGVSDEATLMVEGVASFIGARSFTLGGIPVAPSS